MSRIRTMAAAAAAAASTGASALPIVVSQTVNLGQLLNGTSDVLHFDLSGTLSDRGLSAANIVGGSLVVYGISDASYGAGQAGSYSGYELTGSSAYAYQAYTGGGYSSCYYYSSWSGGRSCYYVPATYTPATETRNDLLRSRDITHLDNVADTMVTTLGGSQATGTVGTAAPILSDYTNRTLDNQTVAYNGYSRTINTYYSRERNVYEGRYGALEAMLDMDQEALRDVILDGIIDAQVSASTGQFRLLSATLSVDVLNPPPPPALQATVASGAAPANVPEPGALALAAAGLAAAAVATRRRRRA